MPSREICEFIRNAIPMRTAAEFYGLSVNRAGFCACPFHAEKTPSFKVFSDHFYCFGCGEHGDVIAFVMRLFQLDFKAAIIRLDYDFGLNVSVKITAEERERAAATQKCRTEEKARQKALAEKRRRYLDMRCELWNKQKITQLAETERIKLDTLDYWLDKNP